MSQVPSTVPIDALRFYPEAVASMEVQSQLIDLWNSNRRFVILSGPPGVGKTRAAEDFVLQMLAKHESKNDKSSSRLTSLFPDFKTKIYEEAEIAAILSSHELRFVWDLCVLHPQYTYEDLIRGFRLIPSDAQNHNLQVREGILGFTSRVV